MAATLGGYGSGRGIDKLSDRFPDPFFDIASTAFPTNIRDALRWCELVMMKNGPYREALNRVISYFITDVEIVSPSSSSDKEIGREEKQKYVDFLNDTLGIKTLLQSIALDFLCYGNSFTSIIVPFRRYLRCPQAGCGLERPLAKIYKDPNAKFAWTNFEFHATCPRCKYRGKWIRMDRRGGSSGDLKLVRWNPHQIDIINDPFTGDCAYVWNIPDDYRQLIRNGYLFQLERADWSVVEAIRDGKSLLFEPDVIYHMREEPLAGVNSVGWGISRVLVNFTQAYYVQILQRANEEIALDYVIPFRLLTPQPRPGATGESSDPVLSINLGGFVSRVQQMLRLHRRDHMRWNILPFPVAYQTLGGDANSFAPRELIADGMATLFNAAGIPAQLYEANISWQAAPAALRLFEANWSHLIFYMNKFLNRICEQVSQFMMWEPVSARLQRVTHADDLNRQMAKLQLMMGGQISRTTGLKSVGLEFDEENRRQLEEERLTAEQSAEMQEELEQAAQMDLMAMPQGVQPGMPPGGNGQARQMPEFQGMAGTMPGGGMPPVQPQQPPIGPLGQPVGPMGAAQGFGAATGSQPTDTPETLEHKARTLAQQIMSMPEAQKDSALIQLRKQDPTLHALVKSFLEDMRRDAALRGRELILQSEYGKQASALLDRIQSRNGSAPAT